MLRYLEHLYPNWQFQGSDNNKFLLQHAKKTPTFQKIIFDDLNHKLKKKC